MMISYFMGLDSLDFPEKRKQKVDDKAIIMPLEKKMKSANIDAPDNVLKKLLEDKGPTS